MVKKCPKGSKAKSGKCVRSIGKKVRSYNSVSKMFIYFVFIAPILAKLIEWSFQYMTFGGLSHLSFPLVMFQIVSIEIFAILTYGAMRFGKITTQKLMLVAPIAYFLKEVYNLIFVYKVFNGPVLVALILEPMLMLFLTSYLGYILFFRKKGEKI